MDYVLIGERTAMLTSSYDRRSPLRYLEKIGADLHHKEVDFWTGDFYVDFEFRGFRFELGPRGQTQFSAVTGAQSSSLMSFSPFSAPIE